MSEMGCRHDPDKGACWECAPWMFRFNPQQVEAMNRALRERQQGFLEAPRCLVQGCMDEAVVGEMCNYHAVHWRSYGRVS